MSDVWTVMNPSPDNMLVDNGKCTVIIALGDLSADTVKNVLLYEKQALPESCEIVTSFKAELLGTYSGWHDGQLMGIVLYKDKDNYLWLLTSHGADNATKARIIFGKRSSSEQAPDLTIDIPYLTPNTYDFKIERQKFRYTAYVGVQGEKGFEWRAAGTHTVLSKNFYPGVAAYRIGKDAKEV